MSVSSATLPILPNCSLCRKAKIPSLHSFQFTYQRPGNNAPSRRRSSFLTNSPHGSRPDEKGRAALEDFRNAFAKALFQAGICRSHQRRQIRHTKEDTRCSWTKRPAKHENDKVARNLSTSQKDSQQAVAFAPQPTREELMGLMDYYHSEAAPQPLTITTRPHSPHDTLFINTLKNLQDESDSTQTIVTKIESLISNPSTAPTTLSSIYATLPHPGAAHLSTRTLHNLLNRLSVLPHKSLAAMLHYMNLLTDMRTAQKPVPLSAWNSAISFAGRSLKRITATEIESALSLWKQMESQAGVSANEVTFNILFDIAAKARKFVLADMLLSEMSTRGHRLTRYARTSLMYFYGLRGDGAGVRRAYRDLVNAGEVVDTTVMSAAVASLLKAGEPAAAEQLFDRAKSLHAEKGGVRPLPPHHWRARRDLARTLHRAALQRDTEPSNRTQATAPLAPGAHAFKALVYHYVRTGDLQRVTALVEEMAHYEIPVQGAVFLYLFRGFAMHGGVLYSGWTRERLEGAFGAFIAAVEAEEQGADAGEAWDAERIHVSRAAVELALSAYMRVADRGRTQEVWERLAGLWRPSEEDVVGIEAYVLRLEAREARRDGVLVGRGGRLGDWLR